MLSSLLSCLWSAMVYIHCRHLQDFLFFKQTTPCILAQGRRAHKIPVVRAEQALVISVVSNTLSLWATGIGPSPHPLGGQTITCFTWLNIPRVEIHLFANFFVSPSQSYCPWKLTTWIFGKKIFFSILCVVQLNYDYVMKRKWFL